MANSFGIGAAVLLAIAGFFMLKNKAAVESQGEDLVREEGRLERQEREYTDLVETLETTEAETEEATAANTELTAQLEEKQRAVKAVESEIADLKDVRDQKKARVEEGNENLAKFGNLRDLQRKLEQLRVDLATLEGEQLRLQAAVDSGSARKQTLDMETSELSSALKKYAEKKSNPALKTRVSRVVPEYGFVVLGGGDNLGIIRDSFLSVVRGGDVIGKLQVTGTESSTAVASIVPDSLQDGMQVRTGDLVVAAN